MTRASMPGRSHLQSVPACSLAESLSAEERVLLAELGMHVGPPRLQLVPNVAAPQPELLPHPAPAADLRRERRRQQIADFTGLVAVLAAASAAVSSLLGRLSELVP